MCLQYWKKMAVSLAPYCGDLPARGVPTSQRYKGEEGNSNKAGLYGLVYPNKQVPVGRFPVGRGRGSHSHTLCWLMSSSDVSDAAQIVIRLFGLRLILADCSQILGKPNLRWAASELDNSFFKNIF